MYKYTYDIHMQIYSCIIHGLVCVNKITWHQKLYGFLKIIMTHFIILPLFYAIWLDKNIAFTKFLVRFVNPWNGHRYLAIWHSYTAHNFCCCLEINTRDYCPPQDCFFWPKYKGRITQTSESYPHSITYREKHAGQGSYNDTKLNNIQIVNIPISYSWA